MSLDGFIAGGTNIKLERLSLTHVPQGTDLLLRTPMNR
jgi:hypothetical protein